MSTPQQLTFLSWVRPEISSLITAGSGGRAQAAAPITLTESDADGQAGRTASETLPFLIAGPADIAALQPGAIVRRYPAPGTLDHESDRCPYVELADPTLPWRYTPAPTPPDAGLHPWLVLVVGLEGSELTLSGGSVTIEVSAQTGAQAVGAPTTPYRFAHVQDSGGHRTTRLLSGRPLEAGTAYLAVVVPAYDATGAPSFTGSASVTVAAYDSWRFRNRGAGRQLRGPRRPPASRRRARVYRPLTAALPAPARGARSQRARGAGGQDRRRRDRRGPAAAACSRRPGRAAAARARPAGPAHRGAAALRRRLACEPSRTSRRG